MNKILGRIFLTMEFVENCSSIPTNNEIVTMKLTMHKREVYVK